MLEGVNIIKKEEIFETESAYDYIHLWLKVVAVVMAAFLIAVILNDFLGFPRFIALFLGTLAGIINVGFFIFVVHVTKRAKKIPTGEYQYIVTLAPEVSYTELTKLYDVTNNNDGTYTLEERNRRE